MKNILNNGITVCCDVISPTWTLNSVHGQWEFDHWPTEEEIKALTRGHAKDWISENPYFRVHGSLFKELDEDQKRWEKVFSQVETHGDWDIPREVLAHVDFLVSRKDWEVINKLDRVSFLSDYWDEDQWSSVDSDGNATDTLNNFDWDSVDAVVLNNRFGKYGVRTATVLLP